MPSEPRHDRARVNEPADPLEAQQQIEIEGKAVALIETAHGSPCLRTHEHAGLRDEVGTPREDPRTPLSCAAEPQLPALLIDVSAGSKGHHRPRIVIEQCGRRSQRARFEFVIVIEPVEELVMRHQSRPSIDRCRETPRIRKEAGAVSLGRLRNPRRIKRRHHDDVGEHVLLPDRSKGALQKHRPAPERRHDEQHPGALLRSLSGLRHAR